jgi:hypothetical protein
MKLLQLHDEVVVGEAADVEVGPEAKDDESPSFPLRRSIKLFSGNQSLVDRLTDIFRELVAFEGDEGADLGDEGTVDDRMGDVDGDLTEGRTRSSGSK